jgi:hypothetical protein
MADTASTRPARSDDFLPGAWSLASTRRGVRAWTRGAGPPIFVFSGLEGSGESCLHLVVPVIEAAAPGRELILLDYSQEDHDSFGDLVQTLHELVSERMANEAGPCWFWSQSYGNLLACSVLARRDLQPERHVLVSPFTRLPGWKPTVTVPVLAITPGFLYRLVIGIVAEWQFGPSRRNFDHPFFPSLKGLTPRQLRIRTSWIRGRCYDALFETVFADQSTRRAVWLGEIDRLVDIDEQMTFFDELCTRTGAHRETVAAAGHVVLPEAVIPVARDQLLRWLQSP